MATAEDADVLHWERLLELDPDLAEALGEDIAQHARDRVGVATVALERGEWRPEHLADLGRHAFALLVAEGLIVRELELAGTVTADLLGTGDIVAFGDESAQLLHPRERWHVSGAAKVAILDDRVLPALHAWPAIGARLIERAARQASREAAERAISQLPRVDLRIRALLWHLAERWGRVGPTGVVVPVELTHGAIGRLVGARRPTVTLALSELARDGVVVRRDDGAWVLRPDSNLAVGDEQPAPSAATLLRGSQRRLRAVPAISEGSVLAQRVERIRRASAEQRARSAELIARSRALSSQRPG